ncbi:hypothetical protein BJY01DRAFT_235897 [Aspergillus pseudoustus]|uniref:ABM domain-containing protein n=1 Tax=Aspergillus pseudoustus TaxID=1810923 RepID=A0ABR4JRL8_9EURO
MSDRPVVQLVIVPHRPVHDEAELDNDLNQAFALLLRSEGLLGAYQGRKFEELYTRVYVLLWDSLSSSHHFLISEAYDEFNTLAQQGLRGRSITWTQHAAIQASGLASMDRFNSLLTSPAIEVAWTSVKEGKVHGYLKQFDEVVRGILENEPCCDGFFISPHLEDPHNQVLLINWKSVDAHHVEFENKASFKACIDALYDYYREFVVPWHIVGLRKLA